MGREREESRLDTIFKGLIIIGIFGVLDLILFGVFGYAGNFVKNFLIGVFGQVIKGYCIAMTLVGFFILFGFKPKVPGKITFNYLLILFVLVCIGHLVTYKAGSELSYSEYLSSIYLSHDTLAGVVVGAIMYPFSKAYTFSLVLFILVLLGLFALVIVNQLDFEIGLKFFNNSKKKERKIFGFNEKTESSYDANMQTTQTLEMYNGDVNGKLFSNDKVKLNRKRNYDDSTIEPIESIGQNTMTEDEQDSLISGVSINPTDIDTEVQLARERLKMFSEASTEIPIQSQMDLNNNQSSDNNEEQQASSSNYIPDDMDKLYFNSYRRQQALGDKASNYGPDAINQPNNDIPPMPSYYSGMLDSNSKSTDDFNLSSTPSIEPQKPEEDPFTQIMNNANSYLKQSNDILFNKDKDENKYEDKEEEIDASEQEETPNIEIEEPKKEDKPLDMFIEPKKEEPKINIVPPKPIAPKPIEPQIEIKETKVEKPKPIIKKYVNPGYDLLREYKTNDDSTDYSEKADMLVRALASFKIDIKIEEIIKGPTFTRIDFSLATGIQVNKITAREDDLKLALAVESLRILAPIPGTTKCGVEIPNKVRSTVGLKEVMLTDAYQEALKKQTGLIFCFGKDVENRPYFYDLTKAPHTLICGGTGSGKSIAINVMICSLLFRYTPQDLRFIFVDPKIVEFSVYKGLPHLMIPNIITEPDKAVNALQWACDEMDRRYRLFESTRTRKIDEYNAREDVKKDPSMKLPYIVIIVDEFNEIMLSSFGKQFDMLIKRLTQKARAAGIHLVLATQRPSVDVVNGTIKSNLPCRIALRVASAIDSITILNCAGAEKLLGNGDMLFLDPNVNVLKRVQGAFIDTPEVDAVVDYVKNNNDSQYDEEVSNIIMKEPEPEVDEDDFVKPQQLSMFPDAICVDALEVCVKYNQVSTSFLQRKFSLGYSRSAKIIDWMMENGYVALDGVKKVLRATQEDVDQLRALENGTNDSDNN